MRLFLLSLAVLALTACGNPLAKLPRLADVDVAQDAGQVDALADANETSLATAEPAIQTASQDRPRGGLLGFLRKKADAAKTPLDQTSESLPVAETPASDEIQLAALAAPADPAPRKKGLFGALRGGQSDPVAKGPAPGAPDYEQVGPGVTLPAGKVARLCGVPARSFGKKVESFPERGGAYTLYDSAPGSTAPRSFFMTGFDDGCARQFTAALTIFGSVETYEQIHYGTPGATQPRSDTDQAYEALKSRVCRVGKGKPCGKSISKLSRNTAFLSVYERFEDNSRWTTLLLHDGDVLAIDTKS